MEKQELLKQSDRVTTEPTEGEEEARRFIRACVEYLGMGFHPDTPFDDYQEQDGSDTFTADEALRLDAAMNITFDHFDPSAEALALFDQHSG